MTKKLEVRGGNSAFFKDGRFITHDQSGCPRMVLLRHHGVEAPVGDIRTQKTFNIGYMNEDLFVKHWLPNTPTLIDGAVREPVLDEVDFVGHIDVQTADVVFELKSVSSRSTWDLVKKGGYKVGNLAQCVNYMLAKQVTKGYLVYSLYAYVAGLELPDIFIEITIDDNGNILVNDKQTGFSLENIVADRTEKAKVLRDDSIFPERPVNQDGTSSCKYCPFKTVCDAFDKGKVKSTDSFLKKAKEVTDVLQITELQNQQDRRRREEEISRNNRR
jgi:hypothetical protein